MKERVAIVAGVRTPFVKAHGAFRKLTLQALGAHTVKELVRRADLNPATIDEVIYGTVLLDPRTPNWAREIVFGAGLPKSIYATSVSNNCISGLVAMTSAADRIALGGTTCAIAGGAESMSNPALLFSQSATHKFIDLFQARSLKDKLSRAAMLRPRDLFPQPPSVSEPSTGLTMGQHMEITAKEWKIPRDRQDEIAFLSHSRAAKAIATGLFDGEIAPIGGVSKDLIVRADTTVEKLSTLKPAFDRTGSGTLTAGNSSALTDGASAILLMSESRAKQEGREILAFIADYEYSAIDPNEGLLMAPAVAVPRLLNRMKLRLEDFDRIEVHEAFAAQVLANIAAWERGWKESAVGHVAPDKLNVLGGSIALGHPFAATGGRMLLTLANELKRNNLRRGLISICAAGAMAGAVVLERS